MAGMSVANNLTEILRQIDDATVRSGRVAGDVSLVAVSKTKPLALIDEANATAIRLFGTDQGRVCFGENYVQELSEKQKARPKFEWHFIGALQSNKVKDVVGRVALIHSVDRMKIAAEISKEAVKRQIRQNILLQVHIGDEATKQGFSKQELLDAFVDIGHLPSITLRGLMCLPPLTDDEQTSRSYFAEAADLARELKTKFTDSAMANAFSVLSMGTTHDFRAAIFEGATHVRIGTAIFGEREKKG